MSRGRESVYTPEIRLRLCAELEAGMYLCDAAYLAGVTPVTVNRWIAKGEAGESPYDDLCIALKVAEAKAKQRLGARVQAGEPGWQGAATFMERRWREQFGRTTQLVDARGADVVSSLADLIKKNQERRGAIPKSVANS